MKQVQNDNNNTSCLQVRVTDTSLFEWTRSLPNQETVSEMDKQMECLHPGTNEKLRGRERDRGRERGRERREILCAFINTHATTLLLPRLRISFLKHERKSCHPRIKTSGNGFHQNPDNSLHSRRWATLQPLAHSRNTHAYLWQAKLLAVWEQVVRDLVVLL